eukprot:COSAG03_NODE_10814_length_627_cov_0.797348_1_plen_71_part_10
MLITKVKNTDWKESRSRTIKHARAHAGTPTGVYSRMNESPSSHSAFHPARNVFQTPAVRYLHAAGVVVDVF